MAPRTGTDRWRRKVWVCETHDVKGDWWISDVGFRPSRMKQGNGSNRRNRRNRKKELPGVTKGWLLDVFNCF